MQVAKRSRREQTFLSSPGTRVRLALSIAGFALVLLGAGCGDASGEDPSGNQDAGGDSDTSALPCDEYPTCDPGDRSLGSATSCPEDRESCYIRERCTYKLACVPADNADAGTDAPPAHCEAYPTCDEGDRQVEQCPDTGSCYTRELCTYRITCLESGGDAGTPDAGSDAGAADAGS